MRELRKVTINTHHINYFCCWKCFKSNGMGGTIEMKACLKPYLVKLCVLRNR